MSDARGGSGAAVTMSQAEYARHRRVSRAAVNKAVRAGRIPLTADRRIDPAVADAAWRSNTDPSKPSNTVSPPMFGLPGDDAGPGDAPPLTYAQSRALREYNLAKIAELERKQLERQLIDVDQVRDIAFRASRAARDLILASADRLAPRLVGRSNEIEVRNVILEDLVRVCEELTKAEVDIIAEEAEAEDSDAAPGDPVAQGAPE